MNHPTVTCFDPWMKETVEIDELLAPLIRELWDADIETVSCCQDAGDSSDPSDADLPHIRKRMEWNAGYAYIDFPGEAEVCAFLDAVASAGLRDAFYDRMTHWAVPGAWRKTANFFNFNFDEVTQPSQFSLFIIQVSFPQTDIDEIVQRLRRYNRRSKKHDHQRL
jgi:hypothetical protein